MIQTMSGVRLEPRPYQQRIVRKALAMFHGEHPDATGAPEPAASSVMIESPTGSGKTIMGLMLAREMQRRHGARVGWVAMRRNLLAQTREENLRRGFAVDLVTISMFDKQPPPVDFLVVDEAQHDAAMSMSDLHAAIRPRWVLGLTATPYRTDRVKLCFEKVIRDAGIQQLIQEGFLSRFHHYTIPQYTPESVAETFVRDRERWGKSIIFFHRLEQCQRCERLLRDAGIRCDVVTASSNRERQLADFEAGRLDVLLNMAILTEGFDCPTLRTAFCRPSGRGCTVQMGGRVFRKHPDVPIKQIVQCRRTKHPFLRTATPEEQYVWTDEGWRTLTVNRRIAAIGVRALQVIAKSEAQLPKVVLAHRVRPAPWRTDE